MRNLGLMAVMIFFVSGAAFAAMVNLTDGRVVQGDIIKQNNKSLQINVNGIAMTYYADEIKEIDGKPFLAAQAQPADHAVLSVPLTDAVSAPAVTPAKEGFTEDKKALILKFIDVFGTRQALTKNFEVMLKQIEKDKPDEAQKLRERVNLDEIIERLLPIYDRNFTSEDLKAFIAFYESPAGKKLITTIPELMKESVKESVKYMEEKFPEAKQGQ
ncbi:MAG: DUF2059 domain-containing protein [Candidatus Omnitrophica bacterium]|nr:DUF2059 domain-containing protein [Candidatus Omnitrophota bacterium]